MINIGVIGCGYWGPNLIRNMSKVADCRVVAVADQRIERLEAVKSLNPGMRLTMSARELVESESIDGIVIATPISTHFEIAKACLTNGKHVLIEKPITTTVADAREFLIEGFARLQVDVAYASEFRFRDPVLEPDTLFVAVTQSGEADDTLGAMQKARDKGAFVLSVCNVAESTVARTANSALYTYSGPESGLASIKTFTTQLAAFHLLALFLASARGAMAHDEVRASLRLLNRIPEQIERILDRSSAIETLAGRFFDSSHALYLGRGINFPIALEGAFKLKQVSSIHAEAYPSAESKHGPIPPVDRASRVVVLAPRDTVYRKTLSNLEEVRARDGLVLAVATEGDQAIAGQADYAVRIPETDPFLNPFLTVVPLQLFAYYAAALRGIDADRPRDPAKSE